MPVKSRLRKPPPKSDLPPKPAAASSKTTSRSPARPPRKKPAPSQSKPTRPHPGRGSSALAERVQELEAKLKEALAAQPAAIDPRELAKAEERIRTLEKEADLLKRGALLVDERDLGTEPRVLFCMEHAIQDAGLTRAGERRVISKRMLYVGLCALHKQYATKYLLLVPSTLYGSGYHLDGRQMHFIFDLLRKITSAKRTGEPVVLWGDGMSFSGKGVRHSPIEFEYPRSTGGNLC